MRKTFGFLGLVSICLALNACQTATPKPREAVWDEFVSNSLERFFESQPQRAVRAGRHEFDGRLPDWSPAGLKREIERLQAERAHAVAFDPATLDERQRFERDYFIQATDMMLFWLVDAEWPAKNPQWYSWSLDPNLYVGREYGPLEVRMKALIKYARAVPKACEQIRGNLRLPMALPHLKQGKLVFSGIAKYLDTDARQVFAPVQDPALQEELKSALTEASRAYTGLADWLAANETSATQDFAIGKERFQRMLWATERVDTPIEKIEAMGWADLEQNLQMLKAACAKFAPKASVAQCLERERRNKPAQSPVAEAQSQLARLKATILAKKVLSIPSEDEALVRESPPYMRWNLGYIDIPGPYEKGMKATYYIAPPDPKWTTKEQQDYIPPKADLQSVSVHEVWPGHFLQYLHANRSASKLGRIFIHNAFSEGWAHYAEEMMLDMGLDARNPETRIGQLMQALLRDARLLSAIGLHTGKMTVEQSEALFREKALTDPGTAKQQAARGTFDPAYLNYTLGKLMIRKLRDDWARERGGKRAWKEFHDRFLSFGGPAVPLVREAMLGSAARGALF